MSLPRHAPGRRNVRRFGFDVHVPVFVSSAATILVFVGLALAFRDQVGAVFADVHAVLTARFDWLYLGSANFAVLTCLFLIVSPLGRVRLGGPEARPRYSRLTWGAMLFAAGIGIGLLFFGVAEPMQHFLVPPLGIERPSVGDAVAATLFHWGLHGWGIYGVSALALAFFAWNRGYPLALRSVFHPVLGDRVWGVPGHFIDFLTVFSTMFGLATSLGLGARQISGGLEHLFGFPATDLTGTLIVSVITLVATLSVVSGLDAGVRRLSEANIVLAVGLMLAVAVLGPLGAVTGAFLEGLGAYAMRLIPLSNWVGRSDTAYLHGWSAFYFAWWFAWTPVVGIFIARISRGRTVREMLGFLLVVPTLFSHLWMSVFGGVALHQLTVGGHAGVADAVRALRPELALFRMFEALPVAVPLSILAIVLTVIFFVTSSDSGSLVVDSITAGGKLDASTAQRIFWCLAEGAIAVALLLGGSLESVQAAAVTIGLPIAAASILIAVGLCVELRRELRRLPA